MPQKSDFDGLIELMAKLRSPDGCPWDRKQTHESIRGHLVEETYEVIDALEKGDFNELKEELGDLLLQVVFHAQMASEAAHFSIEDVIGTLIAKLKRRHPHIFGEAKLETSAEVLSHWEKIKAGEQEERSYLQGVPDSLPALAYVQKMQERARRVGFDWQDRVDILDKLSEEITEFMACEKESAESEDEFGDILFSLVNIARHLNIDAELALRRSGKRFHRRFTKMEEIAQRQGLDFAAATLEEKEGFWKTSKEETDDDNRGS